ncbi:hypothetical protein Misp01_29870 [Microtetraspora sp. NBRC 13810]|uniref:hypothetical protein n=1 Tax=Microtetraspora sp. NBRC 13810 TaxID=3030990 RepID=UPI0024A12B36|nr:hypothetical protein [Microtetraspora sp. NBRC 13810]GLW07857.1 hypothetical protein Misp01_29870 [Microtetraspora sp. NBRC 13810]
MEQHRTILVADVEKYSRRNGDDQAKLQSALVESLDQGAEAAKLATFEWDRQKQGDGQFVVLPARTDPMTVLGPFVTALSKSLLVRQTATFRIRVRLSIHEGPIRLDGVNGFPGDHAVEPARLVGAQPLRRALAARPEACLGVIISERFFKDYVGQRPGGPPRDQFRRVDLVEKDKPYVAYIHLPGHNVHALDLSPTSPAAPTSPDRSDGDRDGPVYYVSGAGSNVATYGAQTNHQNFGR